MKSPIPFDKILTLAIGAVFLLGAIWALHGRNKKIECIMRNKPACAFKVNSPFSGDRLAIMVKYL